jgi:hypothetical protein
MKNSKLSLSTVLTGALLMGAPFLMAGEGHDHSKHDHEHGHEHADAAHHQGHAAIPTQGGAVMSSHDGMTALYHHLQEIASALEAGKVDGVHDHAEKIGASLKDLDKDTSLTAEKKKRVQGYVKNTLKLADKVHHAADEKKMDQAKKDFAKLQAQVDLLDKQFAHSHKPGAIEKPKVNHIEKAKAKEDHHHEGK